MRYARCDVESFRTAYMALQGNSLGQRLVGIVLGRAMERAFCLVQAPITHRALRIDTDTLLKCPRRLVLPKIVKQVQPLVKPHLRFRRSGDLDGYISYPA